MMTADTNDSTQPAGLGAMTCSRSDYCNESAAAKGQRITSTLHGELFFGGCERHPDRLDLSCARIRRVSDGLPLTNAEVWAVLSNNIETHPTGEK
jgi:hypothetical protein